MKTYVLQCFAGQEDKAKEYLEKHIPEGFFDDDQIRRLWIPKNPIYQFREDVDGRKKLLLLYHVLFPGYVFIDAVNTDVIKLALRKVQNSFSYAHLVELGDMNEVTTDELDWIAHLASEEPSAAVLDENKRIHFIDGSMIGADEHIVKFDKRNRRALVSMEMFGREMKVWIAVDLKGPNKK